MERSAALVDDDDRDQVIALHGVSWESYEALLEARGTKRQPRMAYLDGTLELMTTSAPHEIDKKMLGRLVEAFADAMDLSLNGIGSTTFRKRMKRAGLEPDECYCVGPIKAMPGLAIEVVRASGGIDKLEIYRRLGVAEVWFWIQSQVSIHVLVDGRYHERARSTVMRGIDLDEIARLCDPANQDRQTEMIQNYRRSVRRRRPTKPVAR